MSCQKAQGFLGPRKIAVKLRVDAKKERFGKTEVLKLAKEASEIYAARGSKIVKLDPKNASNHELLGSLLGPSGNLRAPTIRMGKRLFVGFSEPMYKEWFI